MYEVICRFWKAYTKMLDERPIIVKSMTSLVGFALGDMLAQVISGNSYNLMRTLRMTLFGILMDGPIGKHLLLLLN
jgi:protein Mpv17